MKPVRTNDRIAAFALWRAASLCVVLALLAVPLMLLPGLVADSLRDYHHVPAPFDVATLGIALSLGTFLALGPLLRVPLDAVFVRPPERATLGWVAFGFVLVATIATAAVAAGGTIEVEDRPGGAAVRAVVAALLFASWAAILEEFLVRGYLLGVIGHRWNWPAAIVVTSTLFAALHHGHATDGPSLVLYLATTGVAGVLFALVTIVTRNVWNAVAIHATWNTLFSPRLVAFRVPGDPASEALVTARIPTESLLVGAGFVEVPESPLAVLVLLTGVGAVFGFEYWRTT